ncbi:rhodanese-like domain-containing protein [Curvivirga aplysinae]|uniref:rhodanese-like domain-containing protein n=1 Tax=Curvivirga aplysinae TaxID=2529852 RepID=UPI0012BC40E2|nr:rhodanese-like domain-containing protein [Curvivirga aplysinae]MTI10841.1 rhodanese-like domain-containing protein [Curvivirga aplysinae]
MKRGVELLLKEANEVIETLSAEDVKAVMTDEDVQLIDIRDIRELWREGKIPGAYHAPRGMLEFWVDPDSPYFKEIFGSGKKLIFYCAAGARSALSTYTLHNMGLEPIAHLGGGFGGWKQAGYPIEEVEQK